MLDSKPQTSAEVLESLFDRHPELESCRKDVRQALQAMSACFAAGGKLLVCGNGGSAADAEHIVGELVKSFRFKRPVDASFAQRYRQLNGRDVPVFMEGAIPALSLVSQTALSTAIGNDEDATGIFAQQVYGYGRPGDVLLGISTSGNSANVVEAALVARALDVKVVALTGRAESKLSALADVTVAVPADETFLIQELHLPVYHALCAALEADLF